MSAVGGYDLVPGILLIKLADICAGLRQRVTFGTLAKSNVLSLYFVPPTRGTIPLYTNILIWNRHKHFNSKLKFIHEIMILYRDLHAL